MSGITNYGPLSDPNVISQAKQGNTDFKNKKAEIPLKYRAQEATMRVARQIKQYSAFGAIFTLPILPVGLAMVVISTVSLGVQKIAEAQFGKAIDLSKDKMKLQYFDNISKSRIDKNVVRGVIDEQTGEILKTLKEMLREERPHKNEQRHLKVEMAKLESKISRLELKKSNNQKMSTSSENSLKNVKLVDELKDLVITKKSIESRLSVLETEIQGIEVKYKNELESFAETRKQKIIENKQHENDKNVLKFVKKIDKKYKNEDGSINSAKFFEDEYAALLVICRREGIEPPSSKDEFIKYYYEVQGIDFARIVT